MTAPSQIIFRRILFLLLVLLVAGPSYGQSCRYDLVYIWDADLDNVLDFQARLADMLDPQEAANLSIVKRNRGDYGLIFDLDGTSNSAGQLMIKHSGILSKASMPKCFTTEDKGYYELYNVSYGLGPNLESLKKQYSEVYRFLGSEVGKNLFIEQTAGDNYTLIYRRRGDRSTTHKVARKHAKILKRAGISTTIIAEKNNPVVFGESSHLDEEVSVVVIKEPVKQKPETVPAPALQEYAQLALADSAKVRPSAKPRLTQTHVEQSIESYIKDLRRKGSIANDERTGWMVYDLTKGESLADINGELSFQAASMIKPFVALAFFHRVQKGELIYGPKSRRNMELMIQYSNNKATNWVMRMVGGPARSDEILRTYYSDIFKNTSITEYIPSGGRTYKNIAQPSDYVRYLQALWGNRLPYSKEMRRLMSLPGRDRLYDNTPIPQGTLVYNKTGSTAHLCGDMGILVVQDRSGNRYPYVLVGIIQRDSRPDNYGDWMLNRGNVIRQVSTLVYEELKKQYKLL